MPETTQDIITRLRAEAAWAANIERQTLAKKLIDYYDGRQLNDLETVIREQFRKPDNLLLQLVMHNIVEFIADERSRVFDVEPTIDVEEGKETENTAAFFEHINNHGKFLLHCKLAEVYANLTRVCGIHTFFDEQRQQIEQIVMPSSVLWVFQREGNPRDYEAVIYVQEYNSVGLTKKEYIHWDEEFAFQFGEVTQGNYAPLPSQENLSNPYGIIPFAFFRDTVPESDFWGEISDYLINAQDTLNVMLTEKKYLEKMQSFSVPVMQGYEGGSSPVIIDPSMPIKIPPSMSDEGPKNFRFETPQARLSELRDSIKDHRQMVFEAYGIDMAAIQTAQSGFALKLRNKRLDRHREDTIPLMRAGLLDLLDVNRVLWNKHFPKQAIPLDTKWVIDFGELEYADDPRQQLEIDKANVELGQLGLAEMKRRDNPDLTPEEAQKQVDENLTQWQKTKRRFGLQNLLDVRV